MQIEIPQWTGQAIPALITLVLGLMGGYARGRKKTEQPIMPAVKLPEMRYVLAGLMGLFGTVGLGVAATVYVSQVFNLYQGFPENVGYWVGWGIPVSIASLGLGATARYAA
jgi:hypothetical protein